MGSANTEATTSTAKCIILPTVRQSQNGVHVFLGLFAMSSNRNSGLKTSVKDHCKIQKASMKCISFTLKFEWWPYAFRFVVADVH